jgi:phosphatidylserine/phosphatidylglycerophosphate/cardiolipin synthase-like enzyme/uncharacterized membrane protein YdjX (TVP38/TMEM64 family)
MPEKQHPLSVKPGQNCWRSERAGRVAVAIDGEAYFRAVREAILLARHRVMILGWDIHSKLQLVRGEEPDGCPEELGALLNYAAGNNGVDIYVLSWDFAMIYLLERESFPLYTLDWKTHSRVHFRLDAKHPPGASQHQKIVVIDDSVAFCGGIDLSKWRWDTPQHRVDDERRRDPDGNPYPPFHDVQMLIDGDAAAALGVLARERWRRATGERLADLAGPVDSDPWPDAMQPIMGDMAVAIARTVPEYEGQRAVREVEQLYLDSIATASRYIYIENQYLTAHCIVEALARRLREEKGPEVVVVMPQKTGGWLEQHTMDVMRARVMKQLVDADVHARLCVYFPQLTTSGEVSTMVHAKLMIVDDYLLRIGSSNLSNRSMRLDCECDLLIDASDDPEAERAVYQLLTTLLAQHLDTEPARVDAALQREGSLIMAIEALRDGEHTLQYLDAPLDPTVDAMVPESALIDPERPMNSELFVSHFVPDDYRPHSARRVVLSAITLAVLLGLAAAWRWTALGELLDLNALTGQARNLDQYAITPLLVTAVFALLATIAVPLTLLVLASVLAFGPVSGFAYALCGAQLSALLSYVVGRGLGRDLVRRYSGKALNNVSKQLSRRGVLAIVTLRIVPVAPFAIINLVAGASHISLRDFALGTLVGLLPGILGIALFADGLANALRAPETDSIIRVVALLVVLALLAYWLRRTLQRRQSGGDATDAS